MSADDSVGLLVSATAATRVRVIVVDTIVVGLAAASVLPLVRVLAA
jgi:hypothetical protein